MPKLEKTFTLSCYSAKITIVTNLLQNVKIMTGGNMSKLTRYNRKIRLTLVKAMSLTCLFCLFYIYTYIIESIIKTGRESYIIYRLSGKLCPFG